MVVTSINVGINPATERDNSFSFKVLHNCGTHVEQHYICPVCNVRVEKGEQVKGIEFPPGNFIHVTEEEISSTHPSVKNLIEVSKFDHRSLLNPMLLDTPYWVLPKEHHDSHYAALKIVLSEQNLVGIGRATFAGTDKEHAVALQAEEDGLSLWTLKPPELLRVPDWKLPLPTAQARKMTERLVAMMVEPIGDSDFELPSRALQQKLVAAKVKGVKVKPVVATEAVASVNVLDSLKESIALMQQRKSKKPAVRKR
jgi:DNA end-binding protein Ku